MAAYDIACLDISCLRNALMHHDSITSVGMVPVQPSLISAATTWR
jgi:hypothetical protein